MKTSDFIAHMIWDMIEQNGEAQLQRNELANSVGCAPSQINYVITSRFTPELGYIVESRRGGGGYVRIRRIVPQETALMHAVNAIGDSIDYASSRAFVENLVNAGCITTSSALLILSALSDSTLSGCPEEARRKVRASIFKNMLLTLNA